MRNYTLLYINGRRHAVSGRDALLSLSDYLRQVLGLVGTKIVCSEGDCGACTTLVGRQQEGSLRYRAIDSCIQFVFQLDGAHVVTVEGLCGELQCGESQLNAVQQSMVDCHGSQCGFCTPGFVVAMTGMLEERSVLQASDLRYGLTGNLCRCTGYTSILDSGTQLDGSEHRRLEDHYPSAEMLKEFAEVARTDIEIRDKTAGQEHRLVCPASLDAALEFLAEHPDATIIAGATDVGVRANKSQTMPRVILDLNRIQDLDEVQVDGNQLVLGALATWTEIEAACEGLVPQFHEILTLFGSPQIRNVGTIGGNIVNASPIADSLPFLQVMNAVLELRSAADTREVNINDFYLGYKQLDLLPGELLTQIRIPLPAEEDFLRLYKVSRRRDLDISSFTAAIRLRLEGETIAKASIAFGAVGPTVLRARQTEAFLLGQPLNEDTMHQAGDIAVGEVTPISDVRGSADYRLQLTRNVLLRFFYEAQAEAVPA